MIKQHDLVGLFMIFFVKTSIKDKIQNFDSFILKTGMMGTLGNKGSCLLRFNYLDTSFAFSCGHLAAGSSKNQNRIQEIIEIMNKNFPNVKEQKFKEHNIYFIFGDLNFRIDHDYTMTKELIKKGHIHALHDFEQFLKSKNVNFALEELEEGYLHFNPTYKYTFGSHEYDQKKKRTPSWCDRIFFKKGKFIRQIAYDRIEYCQSDHKPIFGIFKVYAIKELREEKMKIMHEIKKNILLGINTSNSTSNANASFCYAQSAKNFDAMTNFKQSHEEEKYFDEGSSGPANHINLNMNTNIHPKHSMINLPHDIKKLSPLKKKKMKTKMKFYIFLSNMKNKYILK